MKKLILILMVLAAVMSGSVFAQELTESEKAAVVKAVKAELADPDSAKFKWGKISPQFAGKAFVNYCLLVNTKNIYGGYAGYQPYLVMLFWSDKDGFSATVGSKPDPKHPEDIYSFCADDGYVYKMPTQ